jgi:general stress protein CsbA
MRNLTLPFKPWKYAWIYLAAFLILTILFTIANTFFIKQQGMGIGFAALVISAQFAGRGTTWEFYKKYKRILSKPEFKSIFRRSFFLVALFNLPLLLLVLFTVPPLVALIIFALLIVLIGASIYFGLFVGNWRLKRIDAKKSHAQLS